MFDFCVDEEVVCVYSSDELSRYTAPYFTVESLDGEKKYEFRKAECSRKIDKILLYATVPVKKVIGEAEVDTVLIDCPERIWEMTRHAAGIDREQFEQYYSGSRRAVAYVLKYAVRYPHPAELVEYGIKRAPQSFVYVKMSAQ